jgi:hypothetical protein
MLALYLIAAHLIGDYLLQTRWQAVGKFGWTHEAVAYRTRHVLGYMLPFIPIAFVYANVLGAVGFLVWLAVLHWLTDAQRITVTPGEWLVYKAGRVDTMDEWRRSNADTLGHNSDELPPNPWPGLPLAVDQTLHITQLALLGWWFL